MSFYNAIREGDGLRVIRHWKFLLVAFKSTNHHNYAIEAFNLLIQVEYLCSERQKAQIIWGRFVNTSARKGSNMPSDLFMEHLNRRLKGVIRNLGANKTKSALSRASQSISTIDHICQTMEAEFVHKSESNFHSPPGFGKDLTAIIDVLAEAKVFTKKSSRQHHFYKFKSSLFESYPREKLLQWLFEQITSKVLTVSSLCLK